MRQPKYNLVVDGEVYSVTERHGYFKADMHGLGNWAYVLADTPPNLIKRIRQARRGGQ